MTSQPMPPSPHPRRASLSVFVVLVWLSLLGLVGRSWPVGGAAVVATVADEAMAEARQTRLGRAIKTSMAAHIPDVKERVAIWAWIASAQQRDRFYRQVWPILKARCHGCHGTFRRPKGALPLTRLAHVLPLVKREASTQRRLWVTLAQRLPLLGGLLVLLALLLGTGPRAERLELWSVLALVGLLTHGIGAWLRLTTPRGLALDVWGLALFAVAATGLCGGLVWGWWRPPRATPDTEEE